MRKISKSRRKISKNRRKFSKSRRKISKSRKKFSKSRKKISKNSRRRSFGGMFNKKKPKPTPKIVAYVRSEKEPFIDYDGKWRYYYLGLYDNSYDDPELTKSKIKDINLLNADFIKENPKAYNKAIKIYNGKKTSHFFRSKPYRDFQNSELDPWENPKEYEKLFQEYVKAEKMYQPNNPNYM